MQFLPWRRWTATTAGKAYVLIVVVAAIWTCFTALTTTAHEDWSKVGWIYHGYSPPVWAIVVWTLSILSLVLAPSYPPLAALVYVGLALGIPRYHSHFGYMVYHGILEYVSVLGVGALLLWRSWVKPQFPVVRSPHAMVMMSLGVWIAVCIAVSFLKGRPWNPWLSHHPISMADAVIIFLIAAHMQGRRGEAVVLGMGLGAVMFLRATFSPYSIYRDGDVAGMLVILLPLALLGVTSGYLPLWLTRRRTVIGGLMVALILGLLEWINYSTNPRIIPTYSRPVETLQTFCLAAGVVLIAAAAPLRWRLPVFAMAIAANMVRLLYGAQNRGAGLAFVVVLVLLIIQSRHWWLYLLVTIPTVALGAVVFRKTEYWTRFQEAMGGGRDQASGLERFDIWQAGWRMFRAEPIFGVGPGNYANAMYEHTADLGGKVAHNSFVSMLAETGAVGVLLYTALILMSAWTLWRVSRRTRLQWPGPAARLALTSLWAYVVVGLFITRHDLVLAYALMGWAVALRNRMLAGPVNAPDQGPRTRHPGPPPDAPRSALIAPMLPPSR